MHRLLFHPHNIHKGAALTWAFSLITRADLLCGAVAGVALSLVGFTHPEATLPSGVARLAAQTPVVPAAPVVPCT